MGIGIFILKNIYISSDHATSSLWAESEVGENAKGQDGDDKILSILILKLNKLISCR